MKMRFVLFMLSSLMWKAFTSPLLTEEVTACEQWQWRRVQAARNGYDSGTETSIESEGFLSGA